MSAPYLRGSRSDVGGADDAEDASSAGGPWAVARSRALVLCSQVLEICDRSGLQLAERENLDLGSAAARSVASVVADSRVPEEQAETVPVVQEEVQRAAEWIASHAIWLVNTRPASRKPR